ncbi:MAG: hypothetical protein N2999_04560, partial [Proteobacteria bacterium]|nr:hypothetical protein [Pseudomonadota bacterium]
YEIGILNSLIAFLALIIVFLKNRNLFIKNIFIILCYSVLVVILLGYDEIEPEKMYITYSPFFLPVYFILAYTAGESLYYLKKPFQIILIGIITIGLLVNLKNYLFNFELTKFSHKSYNFTKSKMAMLPRNAILINQGGEEDFPMFFEQKVCKFREDITLVPLSMLGKKWNFRESIKFGTTYTKGYEGEIDNKKAILKAVILFQKEFNNKRVFLTFIDKKELPVSLKLDINGPFYEYQKTDNLNPDFLRINSFDRSDKIIEEISLLNMEQLRNNKNERTAFSFYSSLRSSFK